MVKALARAFRWRKMLDEVAHATIEDLAKAKGIGKTYVSQVLQLTLRAPEIVEAILDGQQPSGCEDSQYRMIRTPSCLVTRREPVREFARWQIDRPPVRKGQTRSLRKRFD